MAGSTDYISRISKAYSTGKVNATNFEDAFPQYDVVTHVGNPDVSSANWQRNDFPFWKYFQKNTSADALNDWRPTGANPPQTRSDLQRNYSSVGSGRIAILIPDKLQEKMDADPAYAQKIMRKLQEWKEDYDRWDNTVAASYVMNVDAVKFYRELNNSAKEIKSEKTEDFQNLFDALSRGKMAEEIRGNYNVTLDVGSIGNCYDLINNYDIRCTNYVRISPQTVQDMEKNPALKNKVLNAIKEFCSKESQIINSSQATNILDCVMLC